MAFVSRYLEDIKTVGEEVLRDVDLPLDHCGPLPQTMDYKEWQSFTSGRAEQDLNQEK